MKYFQWISSILALVVMTGAAQAATVYQDQQTQLDLYGRLYLFVKDTDEQTIEGSGSRFGFRTQTQVDERLKVFANAEFRYDSSDSGNQTLNVRNTYVGAEADFGKLLFGNFDSVYYRAVSYVMDLYEQEGFVAMGKGQSGSRADSVAYLSHDYNGLSFMGQLRQYPKTLVNDEQYVFQLAGQYRLPALTLGLGLVDGNSKTPNPDTQETLVGVSAVYQMSNVLTLSGLLENQKNRGSSREHLAVSVVYDYGQGEIYGSLGVDWNDEDYLGAGISWKFSKPMSVFAEYGRGDVMPAGNGNSVLTAGVRYDF